MLIDTKELIPQYIKRIYEGILKGDFFNENSTKDGYSELYKVIDSNEENLREYFKPLGYILMRRAGYFYFASDEAGESQTLLKYIVDYIDIVDFLKILDSNFSVGYRFTINSMEKRLNSNVELQDIASKMSGISSKNHREFAQKIVDRLKRNGFVEEQDSTTSEYLVLNSYDYIETFLREVKIYE
jgi:hypothetical protein